MRSSPASSGAFRLLGLIATPCLLPRALLPLALFALVGAANTAIDVAVFWLLTELAHVPPLSANVVSYSLGAVNGFVLNKLVTFRHRDMRRGSAEQLIAFILVRVACLALSSLVLALALPLMPSLAAKLVSVVVTFVFAYALSSRLVFR